MQMHAYVHAHGNTLQKYDVEMSSVWVKSGHQSVCNVQLIWSQQPFVSVLNSLCLGVSSVR